MDLSRLGTALVTRWGAATDAGPVRRRNEDSWLAEPPLYAVADGMGGHADGAAAFAAALHRLATGMRPGAVAGARADLVDLDRAIASAAADFSAGVFQEVVGLRRKADQDLIRPLAPSDLRRDECKN